MKMIVAALIGGVVLGFVGGNLLLSEIHKLVTDPSMQGFAIAGVAAFLGVLWGWVAKGVFGTKAQS